MQKQQNTQRAIQVPGGIGSCEVHNMMQRYEVPPVENEGAK
jgi:hypothetical protein